jgi:hypothetical protein
MGIFDLIDINVWEIMLTYAGEYYIYQTLTTIMPKLRNKHLEKRLRKKFQRRSIVTLDSSTNEEIEYWHLDEDFRSNIHRGGDEPAIIHRKNKIVHQQEWWRLGKRHRCNDKPAIIRNDYSKVQEWWHNGRRHRLNSKDEPAVIYSNGQREWWKYGKMHREGDKPALIFSGNKEYYKNGVLHRDNNFPAIIRWNGTLEWWKHGTRYEI